MLVERDAELGCLVGLVDGVGSSGGRVVVVRGEAGVGKSALVRRFVAEVAGRVFVAVGGCDDLVTPVPLGPVWDVARSEPGLVGALEGGDVRGVMEGVLGLLGRGLRPSVVVVEDVQWADEATLDVLRFVGRRIRGVNGVVVVTYRDGEVDVEHPLRGVIGALAPEDLVRITLGPLSLAGVARLVEGSGLDAGEVLALTGGNPLFVTEVVASGLGGVPGSVADAVSGRVAGLSPVGRRVVEVVSVAPGGVAVGVVEEVLGSVAEGVVEAEQRRLLVVRDQEVGFRHELARRAVEAGLGDAERRRLNAEVLGVLTRRGADAAVLVHHALCAGDVDVLVEYGPRAARAAMTAGSHREALGHLRALEPHLDRLPIPEQAALWMDRARMALVAVTGEEESDGAATGQRTDLHGEMYRSITRAIELYREAGTDHDLARALTFAVRPAFGAGESRTAEAYIAEALSILAAGPPSVELAEALAQQAWLYWVGADATERSTEIALEIADHALAVARTVGAPIAACRVLTTKGWLLWGRRGDPEGRSCLEEAAGLAAAHGDRFEEGRAIMASADCAIEHFDISESLRHSRRLIEFGLRHDAPVNEELGRMMTAHGQVWSGDWAAAEPTLAEVDRAWMLARLQARLGRGAARATIERTWERARSSRQIDMRVHAAASYAEYLWLAGEEAPGLVAEFVRVFETARNTSSLAGDLPFWLWELGGLRQVPEWVADPWRLITVGRPHDAAAMWEAHGFPYERALALMHGDGEDRIEALRVFDELGAVATAARLRHILRDEGIRVPRGPAATTRRHPAGLTSRQAEVLALVAEGLTNAEIADRLFVSPRTVDNHVSAILTKLDVTDRHAAVDTARRLRLVSSG